MAAKSCLQNSLVDMVVVLGVDENSGLVPSDQQPPVLSHHEEKLYSNAFEPQILAAISGHVAMFPTQTPPRDENYPPTATISKGGAKGRGDSHAASGIYKTWAARKTKAHSRDNIDDNTSSTIYRSTQGCKKQVQLRQYGSLRRTLTKRGSFRTLDFAPRRESNDVMSLHTVKLPLGSEALNSLVTLCFPDGAYVQDKQTAAFVHHLVLTDIVGDRSYAICLTTCVPYHIETSPDGVGWKCHPVDRHKSSQQSEANGLRDVVYIPVCFVAISKYPYFTVLTDCLSRLATRVSAQTEDWNHVLKEFTLQLTMVPTPPPGAVAVEFLLLQEVQIQVPPPDHAGQPVSDFDLSLPFRHLDLPQVLVVITCILTQQRIVFMSAHYALIVLVCESFLNLVFPFKWNFTLVPLLAWNLIELVEAPGTFIMGCHSRHRQYLEKVDGLVLVDLDLREVRVCPTLNLPIMPRSPSEILSLAIHHCMRQIDWTGSGNATSFSYEDFRASEQQRRLRLNQAVQTACLELITNLFRDVFVHTNPEKRFFHKEQFLQNSEGNDKPFYEKVLHTDIFNDFLKERLAQTSDYWTEFLEKTKPYYRNSFAPQSPAGSLSSKSTVAAIIRRSQSLSVLSTQQSTEEMELPKFFHVTLPNFVYGLSHIYLENCTVEVSSMLKDTPFTDTRAACLYLQGIYQAACKKKLEALESFHELETCNARMFPIKLVSEILQSLNETERQFLEDTAFYHKSALYKKAAEYEEKFVVTEQPVIMELNKIPETDIDVKGFSDLVHLLELTSDQNIITRLFDALTLGERAVVDPFTFEEFYKCWKENELELQEANIPHALLDVSETLLKISDMIKSSFGTGRIALTQKRLLFLHSGSRRCREVIKLRSIKSLEKVQQRSLFNPVPALKIFSLDDKVKPFYATLRDKTYLWYLLVGEMWSGKILAEETKEPSLINIAEQNVLLINAFVISGKSEFCYHHDYEQEEAETLCYFLRRKEEGGLNLPPNTKEFLQHQMDPNIRQSERVAVESLLYTPGRRSASSQDDYGPKLWCGMSNGRILVYDAASWTLEKQCTEAKDRVVCLIAAGDRQVWAGSFDTKIYVLNLVTMMCNQVLSDHSDVITDFTHGNENTVYSCSLNGQILKWEPRTLKAVEELYLPGRPPLKAISLHNQLLWCLTREELLVLTLNGNVVKRVFYHSGLLGTNRMSLSLGSSVFSPSGIHTSRLSSSGSLCGPHNPNQLDCFIITPQNEVWVGLGRQGEIAIYYADSLEPKQVLSVPCRGISKMVLAQDKVWAGSKDGILYVYNALFCTAEQQLHAHDDSIRALCGAQDRYVLSGAGSLDGKIAIWKV